MAVALPELNDAEAIAERLSMPRNQVQKVLEFLIKEGLVKQDSGTLEVGARRTHLGAESTLVSRHHQNWRMLAIQKMPATSSENLFYTGPMSLSNEVAQMVRNELPAIIERINKWVLPSPSETIRCLNIDWFEY